MIFERCVHKEGWFYETSYEVDYANNVLRFRYTNYVCEV